MPMKKQSLLSHLDKENQVKHTKQYLSFRIVPYTGVAVVRVSGPKASEVSLTKMVLGSTAETIQMN